MKYAEGEVSVNRIKIHYYRTGLGKTPFVLLHGATDNGLCWTPVAEWLSENYDVIMPDAQGHGKSDRLTPGFKFSDHAWQIAGLINQLNLKKPLIMGHSMGAGTAVNIAVSYPDLPKAIILEDPAWREPVDPSRETHDTIRQRQEMLKTMAGFAQMSRDELMAEGRKSNPKWSESELKPWVESKSQFDPNLFKNLVFDGPTYKEQVPFIKCPTLLITSESGIVEPAAANLAQQLWKSTYPFRCVKIMGAGHNIRREQFAEFKNSVTKFLESLG
ncbi:MAG TPA: alpha/beta hydrolase [Dehalococcoidales bacterium]|nr:alpha/beta hydrolase [Dehalococcoidales bacterium]